MNPKKETIKKHKPSPRLLIISLFLLGLALFLYPFISSKINQEIERQLVAGYQQRMAQKNQQEIEVLRNEMEEKNTSKQPIRSANHSADQHSENQPKEPSFFEKHTIGVIRIPKIAVELPIFDGTQEIFLAKGAGLLEGTSYPTGQIGTHAVLSAHRGLPEAQLFTELPKLNVKDLFFLEVLNEKRAYQVEEIQVITPTETAALAKQEGRELVTLMTCTPYMINSHRLLVTGVRVPYPEDTADKIVQQPKRWLLVSLLIGVSGLIFFIYRYKRKSS